MASHTAGNLIQVKASGLMCSFCTMSVEKALGRVPGVTSVQVNLVHGIILVDADRARVTEQQVATKVEELGYTVVATEAQQYSTDEALFATVRRRGILGVGLAVADTLFDPVNVLGLPDRRRAVVSGFVAAVVLLWVGYPILRKTLMAAGQRVINANVLLSSGAWGAFAVGVGHLVSPTQWPNFFPIAAWLMGLHLFFGAFKLGTRKRAAESVRRLLSLQAQEARVVRHGTDGAIEVEVPVAEVRPGDVVAIRPGERVPLDGVVRDGASSFDLSSVTGESAPVYREAGGEVVGGTMNLDGFVRVEVTRPASEGFVAQVVRLMRQIEERKPPIQLLMDRLMNYYGPVVYVVAALAFVGWLLATRDASRATLVAISVVILGYPCALGLTTPLILAIGGGHGIARGLLVRAGEFFQALAGVDTVAFDKTGTLTYGRPTVSDVIAFHGGDEAEVLGLIAAAEAGSEHPLAGAIVRYAHFQEVRVPEATGFRAAPGKGVVATVGGRRVAVGRRSFLAADEGVRVGAIDTGRAEALEGSHTVVYAAADGRLVGAVALQDTPRPGTAGVMRRLRALGVRTAILTGDSQPVAAAVAGAVGVDEVYAELLPAEKVDVIERLQGAGRRVAMVGDGINDAPALVQSDVGIALGAGTDVAMESAGVVLVSDKLDTVVSAILLGRASHRKMRQNIAIAVAFNALGIGLAVAGLVTTWVAIGIIVASVAAVLLSTLALLRLDLGAAGAGATADDAADAVVETVIPARRMHCDACARRIRLKLGKLDGVRTVDADAVRKEVFVAYEPARVSEERLRDELAALGFGEAGMNPAAFIEGLAASVAQYPLLALAVALAGGALSTSVCPCTLPTGVGILGYVGGAVGGAVGGTAAYAGPGVPNLALPPHRATAGASGAALSLAFFVGLVAALTALGTGAAAAGRMLSRYDVAFSVVAAVVTAAVGAAALAGPWVRRRVPDPEIRQRGGVAGALAYGVAYSVATLTSSTGPLVLLLTVAAAIGRPAYGALLSLGFAVGRGLPFLALGLAAGHAGRRLSPWLQRLDRGRRTVEIVSGVALLGLAGYFLWLATVLP